MIERAKRHERGGWPTSRSGRWPIPTSIARWLRGGIALLPVAAFCHQTSAQEILFAIDGHQQGESIAESAAIGDLDGDGVTEILLAATPDTLRIYSGRTGRLLLRVAELQPPLINLGRSVAGAGDFDGDGTPDFVAGATNDSPNNVFWAGSIRVYSGVDGHELGRWNGDIETGRTGWWVAGLGDVDGDGYDDVACTGLFDRVWILGGPDCHLIRYHDGVLTRPSVAGVGDMDRDGRPDYVIGWPQDSTNGLWTGRATVFSGVDGSEVFTVYGEHPQDGITTGDHLGLDVAGAGDVNADGVPDFAAGAPGEIDTMYGATQSRVRVYSGVDASILWEWEAKDHTSTPHTQFGHRITAGADINGDGHDDVLVAAPFDAPTGTYPLGSVTAFSGRTGELLWRTFSPEGSYQTEWIALYGDLDGDGLADFGKANPGAHHAGLYSGRITIYAGARGDVDRICAASANSVGPGARLDTSGPISIGNGDLKLSATGAVPGQTAWIFYGYESAPLPFGDGTLCIGAPAFRLRTMLTLAADGSAELPLDFGAKPLSSGPGRVLPGAAATFQLWYRDPAGPGGTGFNLSDALRIRFLP